MGSTREKRVEAVMSSPVETISAENTIREAAAVMHDQGINALLVPGANVGILTSTDVLDAVADGHDPGNTNVADVMTVPVESITSNLRLPEAAEMMDTYGINHLPVRDTDGDYVGMVSSTDLREQIANDPADV